MKIQLIKSLLALSLGITLGFTGCASDPVVTSQTTTTRRVSTTPVSQTTVTAPGVVHTSSTTTQY